jgi:GTP-binding protein
MSIPRIAIVGRPNVGKSTLANRMAGRLGSIVEPTAGVTRDRIAHLARLPRAADELPRERLVEVLDTGGIGIVDRADLARAVEEQVAAALRSADLVIFLVDGREGLTPLDREVARRLRGIETPVVLVVNKVEGQAAAWEVDDFRRLGVARGPLAISAQHAEGLGELYEALDELLPPPRADEAPPEPALRVAVIGRRNAGKSTFVNQLAGEERVIVSELPGTTRDAVDVFLERDGELFQVIDTAGVRKRGTQESPIEVFSEARAFEAIRRAQVVLVLFDALERPSEVEKKLARYAADHYKPLVLVANKWDLAGETDPAEYARWVARQVPGLDYVPVSLVSAKTGAQVWETLALARELERQGHARVGTAELNRVLAEALAARSPSAQGASIKILYATQTKTAPPTFTVFVNDKELVSKGYLRYLENRLRAEFPFPEIPVRVVLRDRGAPSGGSGGGSGRGGKARAAKPKARGASRSRRGAG